MGGRNSTGNTKYIEGSDSAIVSIMLPVYYIHDADVLQADIDIASESWKLIIDDKSDEFKLKKATDTTFNHYSCISWFFSSFYGRLFDVHPLCKPLFSAGLQSQGKFLVKMITITLSQLSDPAAFKQTMHDLTVRHSQRGVKSIEYGIVGDVLFWCINLCIGAAGFTAAVETAWHKIYSKMLQVIVPVAISFERQGLYATSIKRTPYITKPTVSDTDTLSTSLPDVENDAATTT